MRSTLFVLVSCIAAFALGDMIILLNPVAIAEGFGAIGLWIGIGPAVLAFFIALLLVLGDRIKKAAFVACMLGYGWFFAGVGLLTHQIGMGLFVLVMTVGGCLPIFFSGVGERYGAIPARD